MTPETMKELLFSLVWYGHSAHHSENAKRLLDSNFSGDTNWEAELDNFAALRDKKPGRGDPRMIVGA